MKMDNIYLRLKEAPNCAERLSLLDLTEIRIDNKLKAVKLSSEERIKLAERLYPTFYRNMQMNLSLRFL